MKVRELLRFIEEHGISMDADVYVQRVEDAYFEGQDISGMRGMLPDGTSGVLPPGSKTPGWPTVRLPGYSYYNAVQFNKQQEGRPNVRPYSEEELEQFYDEYVRLESPVDYKDPGRLYLTPHY
jgi:hypothetical protein